MNTQTTHQFSHEELPPEIPKMTLEEFLESDLEGKDFLVKWQNFLNRQK